MSELSIRFAALTDVGRARKNNEDAFQITDLSTGAVVNASSREASLRVGARGALLALSDGMGGHAGGEIASAVVMDSLRQALLSDAGGQADQRLEAAIRRANADVAKVAKERRKHGMGATLTAALVDSSGVYVAEVGDSRAYLLRAGQLKQLTRDQSLVQMMIDVGLYTKEQAEHSPQKNILLQAMGLAPEVHAALAHVTLRQQDKMLLCSDGISNAIEDDELRGILQANEPNEACLRLIQLANDRGGEDNLTAIVAVFEDRALPAPSPAETVTATFKVIKGF